MNDVTASIKIFTTISQGVEIHGRIHLPSKYPAPAIICSHGLFGDKDGAKFVKLAQHLADRGFVVVRYDHQGCGQSKGNISETTLTNRCADLAAVSDYLEQTSYASNRIGLMGSSMGGLVSLCEASENCRYHAVVTWATPWEIRRPRNTYRKIGTVVLGDAFYTDLGRYPVLIMVKTIRRCMILHGSADELVPLTHACKLYANLGEPKEIRILGGADHRFTDPQHRRQAINYTADFFCHHLMEQKVH